VLRSAEVQPLFRDLCEDLSDETGNKCTSTVSSTKYLGPASLKESLPILPPPIVIMITLHPIPIS